MAAQGKSFSYASSYQGRSIMGVELGQSGRILPRKGSGFLIAVPTRSGLHWGGISGAATL